jgi:hypothetical protein
MKILILGTGWYGCHAAMTLLDLNISFNMADITNDFFTGSSSKNQNRLHLGFHYCRNYPTRTECYNGFKTFMEKYSNLTREIPLNLYCIAKSSIIDSKTYKNIYSYENISFSEYNNKLPLNMKNITKIIKVDERYIDFKKAKEYFKEKLNSYMIPNYKKEYLDYLNEQYDYIIDCTFSKIENTYNEKCITFLYKYKYNNIFAYTIVDGPFISLYPYDIDNNIYTLTDVENTPINDSFSIEEIRLKVETKTINYIPDFKSSFEYDGYYISNKIKPIESKTDDRSLIFKQEDKTLIMRGGKVGGIFTMEDIIREKFKTV